MKKILYFIIASLSFCDVNPASAQNASIDTIAVSILDRMSLFINDLKSCSTVVKTNYDVASPELGLVKHSDKENLYISGGKDLYASLDGDKGTRDFVFDGNTFTYYSVTKNHFAQVAMNCSLIEMIDSMNKHYGIIFPAADFLYPNFVNDILAETSALVLLGTTSVDGKECYHIAGVTKEMTYQFWISTGPFCLPAKMVLVYRNKPMNPQFEAHYTDWAVNPILPDNLFEFQAPPNARKIKLTPVNEK